MSVEGNNLTIPALVFDINKYEECVGWEENEKHFIIIIFIM